MASLSHSQARSILDQAWRQVHGRGPTSAELAFTQAIALLETGYGRAGQFGAMADRGQFNWGALETRAGGEGGCPPGTAPGNDLGTVCFFVYPSDLEAAKHFVTTLTKSFPNRAAAILRAMNSGRTAEAVARAMRTSPAYYSGNPGRSEQQKVSDYASAIGNALRNSGSSIGSAAKSALPVLLGLGLLGGAGYYWWTTYGSKRKWSW